MHVTTSTLLSLLSTPLVLAGPVSKPSNDYIRTVIQRRSPAQAAQAAANQNGKAIYMITNEDQNAVAAIAIQQDGTLGQASITPTGGAGDVGVDATGKPATPDALISQSSLTIAGNNLFAVNAGSNTISMFAISPNDPLSLKMIGQPAKFPGTFPNTIAASAKNNLVCAASSGSQSGLSCANFDQQNGIGQMDGLRSFDLGQSDPPVGPTNTVSQSFFSEDETMLFTTVKGDPPTNKTGFLSVFPVNNAGNGKLKQRHGRKGQGNGQAAACAGAAGAAAAGTANTLSTKETRSSPNGTAVLFGSANIPGANPPQIFATDASFGAGILTLDQSMQASLTAETKIDDQKATCWTAISPVTNTAFVTDVGKDRILEMSLTDAKLLNTIDLTKDAASAQDPGLIDLKAQGGFVYALSPGNGTTQAAVSVVDVNSKKLVQHAVLGNIGVKNRAQGMAVLA